MRDISMQGGFWLEAKHLDPHRIRGTGFFAFGPWAATFRIEDQHHLSEWLRRLLTKVRSARYAVEDLHHTPSERLRRLLTKALQCRYFRIEDQRHIYPERLRRLLTNIRNFRRVVAGFCNEHLTAPDFRPDLIAANLTG